MNNCKYQFINQQILLKKKNILYIYLFYFIRVLFGKLFNELFNRLVDIFSYSEKFNIF